MRKIMFDNKFGLEDAVLNGKKTMTRRIIPNCETEGGILPVSFWNGRYCNAHGKPLRSQPFHISEQVAIAQNYKNAGIEPTEVIDTIDFGQNMYSPLFAKDSAGWTNKMFVKAELMPRHILISDVSIERLQDISDADALKEGIYAHTVELDETPGVHPYTSYAYDARVGSNIKRWWYKTPREAFHQLICKIYGENIWINNPYVFVYSFKLI